VRARATAAAGAVRCEARSTSALFFKPTPTCETTPPPPQKEKREKMQKIQCVGHKKQTTAAVIIFHSPLIHVI